MVDETRRQPEQPQQRRPSYLLGSILAGILIFAVGLAIGGYTGIFRTEYKVSPEQQAVLLVLGASWYGAIPGLIVGLLLDWWGRRKTDNRAER
jgi:hypothetical protein